MMDFWQWIAGTISVELTSADIAGFLAAAQNAQVEVKSIEKSGPFSIQFLIQRNAWRQLYSITQRRGERLEQKKRSGLYWSMLQLRRRPVLIVGLLALFLLSIWAPSRVFFVRVDGNAAVPARKIVMSAAQCGIAFGASRREVRSEKVKNALLDVMPELSWAGVNTYGCTAVISVRERKDPQSQELSQTVSSIVASRDGVIQQITVLQGNKLCSVGQAVKQGQVLISGYTDCGLSIQATNAKGEVFAHTIREMSAISPTFFYFRDEISTTEKKYSLILGNKRINFSNSSGISGTGCAKIYDENYIVLPGGFQLPVALCVETWIDYETELSVLDTTQENLPEFSRQYLLEQMCAGSIYITEEQFAQLDDILMLRASYNCLEMIGITRLEENLLDYGEND